ncbi:MAG: hypothetical protein E7168_03095 [Firmicutes bacterium]|nr:hypothetical protein [Bacillota bacterium]
MEQHTSKLIEDMIARISTSYLKEYRKDIVGVYLVPFTIGGHQKIEIVIVSCGDLEVKVKPPKKVNELTILSSVTNFKEYVGAEKEKRYFELKGAYILYDPTKRLERAKESLLKDEEVSVYYNIYEVPENMVKTVKSTLYKVREKNKQASKRI